MSSCVCVFMFSSCLTIICSNSSSDINDAVCCVWRPNVLRVLTEQFCVESSDRRHDDNHRRWNYVRKSRRTHADLGVNSSRQ